MTTQLANVEQEQAWNGTEGVRWTQHEERYNATTAAHTVHLLRAAAISEDDRVLDIGCGCGATTRAAAGRARSGQALGLDLSEPMLARARERAREQGLANVVFLQADAQVHDFESAEFDVVISKYGATFFGDPVAALRNIGRAVRPGGRLVLLAWADLGANPWVGKLRAALAAGREMPDPPPNAPGPFGWADPDYARDVLAQSGWIDAQFTEIKEPVRLGDDPDDAFAFVSQLGFTLGLLADLDSIARDESLRRVRSVLADAMTDDGVTLPSVSWLIQAQRRPPSGGGCLEVKATF